MKVKRFGEKGTNQWYELSTNQRIKCDEETIAKLWCDWIVRPDVARVDTTEFTVFEFNEPIEIDLASAENWTK